MSNILILDTIGERYGMLPSQVLAMGSTLDLYVLDAATSWHNYQSKKAEGKYADNLTQDEMLQLIERSKKLNG